MPIPVNLGIVILYRLNLSYSSVYRDVIAKTRQPSGNRANHESIRSGTFPVSWPEEFLPLPDGDDSVLDHVGLRNFAVDESGLFTEIDFELAIQEVVVLILRKSML